MNKPSMFTKNDSGGHILIVEIKLVNSTWRYENQFPDITKIISNTACPENQSENDDLGYGCASLISYVDCVSVT